MTCHDGQSKQAGLDLSTRDGLLRGGDRGPAIVPGNAKASLLYKLITHEQQPAMPLKADKLPEEVIGQIGDWINAGAPYAESLKVGATASGQPSVPSATAQLSKDSGMALFVQQIRPVLETQCLKCHGGGQVKRSGLDLSSREGLLRGGDTGPVIVPGDAQSSLLYKRVKHEVQPGMPFQGEKLPEEVIARIAKWISAGAPYDQPLKLSSASQPVATEPGSNHWAFKPPQRPSIPAVKNRGWVRNPIDAFIAAEHEKRGLKPMPTAEKGALLRRLYLDLIGLPPTPEELHVFLADRSSNAYEKVVDRLLESPLYGERWGRHWMDIWRYSDWFSSGDQVRNSQPNIWNWRDWIIESLNQDKGYDQMIQEMLAGDEIAPTDPKTLRATGYLARNWYRFNRNVWLQDVVEHTATGFLGITLKCARCHDHKFDPIAQEEYYRFRAFFESYDVRMDRIPGQPDLKENEGVFTNGLPRAYDAEPREPTTMAPYLPGIFSQTFRFIRGDERNPDKDHPLTPGVPEVLGSKGIEIRRISLPIEAAYPDLRAFVHEDLITQGKAEIGKARTSLENAKQQLALARQRVEESQIRERRISATRAIVASSSGGPDALEPATGRQSFSEAGLARDRLRFDKDIKPILEKNCFSCHDANNGKSGLILETVDLILQGGDLSGPAVVPRKSRESPLVQYLRAEKSPRMPFGGQPRPEGEIDLIAKWIDQLPEEDPHVSLRKAEQAVALGERELAARQAYLPALEARIAADKAKYSDPPDPKAETLTQAARKTEGQAQILKCEENLLRAQQKLADVSRLPAPSDEKEEKVREKKIEGTRKELDAAVAALKQAGEGYTPIGKLYPKTSTGRRLALAHWIANKSMGAWVHYGLGSLNENLPQFVVLGEPSSPQCGGNNTFGGNYLGPEHGGVQLEVNPENPLPFAFPGRDVYKEEQSREFQFVERLNKAATMEYPDDPAIRARIKSYELAFRMQSTIPELFNFKEEGLATEELYGLDQKNTKAFGQTLLTARRLVERGVRFVQVFHGEGKNRWDAHSELQKTHSELCAEVDQPIAGLLKDLKQRGLLDETLVVWATEFGRTPGVEGNKGGRDHHPFGFSVWMAGAGIKPGIVHGSTDELGFHAVENRHYVTDIHATVLHQLGLDPRKLEVPGQKRLEIDFGNPIKEIII